MLYPQHELVIKTKEILHIKNCHITTVVCQCHIYASCRIQIIECEFCYNIKTTTVVVFNRVKTKMKML